MSLRNLPVDMAAPLALYFLITEGNAIGMPKDVPHAVYAQTVFKMLLVVVKA